MQPKRTLFAVFIAFALLIAQGHVLAHVYAHEFAAANGQQRDSSAPHAEYCKTCDLAAQFAHALVGDGLTVSPERVAPPVARMRASAFSPALFLAFSSRAPPSLS